MSGGSIQSVQKVSEICDRAGGPAFGPGSTFLFQNNWRPVLRAKYAPMIWTMAETVADLAGRPVLGLLRPNIRARCPILLACSQVGLHGLEAP